MGFFERVYHPSYPNSNNPNSSYLEIPNWVYQNKDILMIAEVPPIECQKNVFTNSTFTDWLVERTKVKKLMHCSELVKKLHRLTCLMPIRALITSSMIDCVVMILPRIITTQINATVWSSCLWLILWCSS